MPYAVEITRVATGQTVTHHEAGDWDDDATDYLWTDGNYGCDCNRALFFGRAGGNLEGDPGDCGMERFTCSGVRPDGARFVIDDPVTP